MMLAGRSPSSKVSATSTSSSAFPPSSGSSSGPARSSGMIIFAIRIPPGADMKAAASRYGRYSFAEQACVGGEDGPRDPRHSDRHHREQLRRGQRRDVGSDGQRRFRLADEDVGGRAERFDPADPGHPADRASDPADDALHDSEMVEDGDQRSEEDDDRKRGDGKGVGERIARARPEQEFRPLGRIAEEVGDAVRHALDGRAAPAGPDHQPGDRRLQRESGGDHAKPDRLAVRRQQPGEAQDRGNSEDAEELIHGKAALPRLPDHALGSARGGFVQQIDDLLGAFADQQLPEARPRQEAGIGDMLHELEEGSPEV